MAINGPKFKKKTKGTATFSHAKNNSIHFVALNPATGLLRWGEEEIAEKSFREAATGHVQYTEEPLLRWLKDFCRTAAPY